MSSINSLSKKIEKNKLKISKYQGKLCKWYISADSKAEYRRKIKDLQNLNIDLEAQLEKKKRKEAGKMEGSVDKKSRPSSNNHSYDDDHSLTFKIIFTIIPILFYWWIIKIPFYLVSFPIRFLFSKNKRLLPYYSFKKF